ncbi:MAG: GlxA family transcriptional regulator, partial [Mesorhizobium sp.]
FSKAYRDAYGCAPHQSRLPVHQRKKTRSSAPEENRIRKIDRRLSYERVPNCH